MDTIDTARIQSLPLFATLSADECAELARHVATTPVQLLALFGTQFRVLEVEHPELAGKVRQVMASRET